MATTRGRRITAAGTVLVRTTKKGQQQVLLIHRPGYDDWSLPKGKINADEYLAGCAVRETLEETGVTARLCLPLDRIGYPVGSGYKTVSYWRADVLARRPHKPDAEVDQNKWLSVEKALATVSYPDEAQLIEQAVGLPRTVPVLVARHAKAMLRKFWTGRDQARPLDSRGRRQSELLVPLLQAYGVQRAVSSSSTRCMQTLKPFAKAAKLDIEGWTTLSEEQSRDTPKAVTTLMQRLVAETLASQAPLAICGHRPVLPLMLDALGVPARPLQPGAVLVAHLDATDGHTVAVEFHKPRI
ncbi:MAG: NUDIX domain-containing protein [Propionibacteriaceae bacterium]|nr:NUDIX domain-containing protein [Propionibacteriaceae bacterium]